MKPIILSGHSKEIKDMTFNKDSDLLFSGSSDRYVTLWVSETGERIGTYKHSAAVYTLKVTLDSKLLITGDSTGGCYIWEVSTGSLLKKLDFDMCAIRSIDLSMGDKYMSVSYSGREKNAKSQVDVFNIEDLLKSKSDKSSTLPPSLKSIVSSSSKFMNTRWMNLNKNILCSREDGFLQMFDYETGNLLLEKKIHDKAITDIDISAKEEIILTASQDGRSLVIDPDTFDIVHSIYPKDPVRGINSCKISPLFSLSDENEEKYHAFIGGGMEARDTAIQGAKGGFELLLANLMYGEEIGSIQGHFSPIYTIALSQNGKLVATGAHDSTVRLMKLEEDYTELN